MELETGGFVYARKDLPTYLLRKLASGTLFLLKANVFDNM